MYLSRRLVLTAAVLMAIATVAMSSVSAQGIVVIEPGDSIQAAASQYPEGTIFVLRAGVYRRQTVRPRNHQVFTGEPGTILDGENATPRAFIGEETSGVTIRGL